MLSRYTVAASIILGAFAPAPLTAAHDERRDEIAAVAAATSITIYSDPSNDAGEASGRALVQQRRRIELPQGEGRVELADIPASLDPATVLLRAAGNENDGRFTILEQALQGAVSDPDAVLRQYIGQDVLINRRQSGVGEQARLTETINAKLLAFDDKVLVLQTNNRQLPIQVIARGPEITEIKLMAVRATPPLRPTLSWLISSEKPGPRDVDLIYESRGLAWDAHYTLLLDATGAAASLDAWANVVNRSGAAFADAEVHLVIEREGDNLHRRAVATEALQYLLPRRASLPPDGARRLPLLDGAKRVSVSRMNVVVPDHGNHVMEALSLPNTRENHLGLPLPPGRVRVMRRGGGDEAAAAHTTLVAASRAAPTAVNGAMIVPMNRADGLVATRDVTESHETIDGHRRFARITKVTIGNRRKENARALVIEDLPQDAERIIQHSHPYDEKGAGAAGADVISFALDVPAGEAVTLSYTVALEGR